MKLPFLAGATLALAVAGMAVPAAAATYLFDSAGDTASVTFNGMVDGTVVPGLTGEVVYTLNTITGGSYNFGYTATNTSSSPVTASRISSFGFNTTPDLLSAAITGGSVFTNVSSGNVPGGLPDVDFCAVSGSGNNCSGGASGGVAIGGTTSGSFSLNFGATAPTSVAFSDLYVRYQAITAPGIIGGSGEGIPTGGVPEPASWALMIMGIGGIGAVMRRRRTQPVLA
jgi:hypothetical protein